MPGPSPPPARERPASARTKLIAPPLPATHAVGAGLLERVAASVLGCPATLVRAPGGAGKTVLARAVVDEVAVPWAWITLDEWDDRQGVVELLYRALAGIGIELAGLRQLVVGTATPWSVRDAVSMLVNDLLDAGIDDVVLVLDDLHALERAADAVALLVELVELAPPCLHLLGTTRRLLPVPVARVEAGGRLAQIEPDALRIDREQAARMLRLMGVDAGEEAAARLVERTGGWVTGLRLLAARGDDGTHPTTDLVGRYVEEELLAALPDDDARALADLAVLRRIGPADVAALTGRPDGRRLLDTLAAELPVFVSWLDDDTVVLHELLRESLLRVLAADTDRLRRLHLAAAGVADDWQQQLHHLLAAGAPDEAVDVLESRSRAEFPRLAALAQVRTLMDHLPRARWEDRRWLRIVEGVTAGHLAQHATAQAVLRSVVPDLHDADVLTRWAAERYLQRAGDDPRARTERLRALETEEGFGDLRPAVRAEHEVSMAHGALFTGRWDDVAARHRAAIEVVVASGDVVAAEVVSQNTSPYLAVADGGVDRIDGYVEWLGRRLGDASPLLRAAQHTHRVLVAFLRGDLTAVDVHAAAAADLPGRLRLPYLRVQIDWARVCAMSVRGDLAPAVELLESRRRDTEPGGVPPEVVVAWIAPLARLRRAQGHHEDVRALARSAHEASRVEGPQAALAHAPIAVCRAQEAAMDGRMAAAVDILGEAVRRLGTMRVVPAVGRLQLDLVVALADAGRRDDALDLLRTELALLDRLQAIGLVAATGRGLLGVLDRAIQTGTQVRAARAARAVLDADVRPTAVTVNAAGVTLSPREVEVLRLLSRGLSNPQIADELVLSVNTVKTHVRTVLRKLDVPSRAAAAGAATGLGVGPGRAPREGSPG